MTTDAKPVGRPTLYNQEVVDAICARIAEGQSLRQVCRDDEMPSISAVLAWLNKYPEFQTQYARAKEASADALADEILDIANNTCPGVVRTIKADGGIEEKTADMIEHRRLQIDARKWLLGKIAPKKYGDKLAVGGDDDMPAIKVASDPLETARRIAFLLAKAAASEDKQGGANG